MAVFYSSEVSISIGELSCSYCNGEEVQSTAMAELVPNPLEEPKNVSRGYYMPEDTNTQSTYDDFILLEPTQDAGTPTTDEDFTFLEPTRDEGTQTTNEDFVPLEAMPKTSTQTTIEDFMLIESTHEASTQTTIEDFMLIESTHEASTQTTNKDILLKPTLEASIQTTGENINRIEPIRDVSTQLTEEEFSLYEPARDASIRSTDVDFILLEAIRDSKNPSSDGYFSSVETIENSIYTSETSACTGEKMFDCHRYNNSCCTASFLLSNGSSALELPRNFHLVNNSRNQPIPNDMQIARVHARNKINASNHQGIIHNSRVHQRPRHNISETGDLVISPNSRQCGMGKDSNIAMLSQIASDNNRLAGFHQDSLNSAQGNREIQILGNFNRRRLLTVSRFKDVALNMIISQTAQKENIPGKISDSKLSSEKIYPVADKSAVPDSSSFRKNKQTSNIFEKKSKFPLVKSALSERKKRSICWICNMEYNEHATEKNFYKCCVCRYASYTKRDLKLHTSVHRPEPFSCKICGEGFTEKGSHGSDQTCKVCWKVFQCKTLLEQHSLVHKKYNSAHCGVCKWKINEHVLKYREKRFYRCCGCSYKTHHKNYLQQHLDTHAGLILYRCDDCGRCFTEKKNLERHFQTHIMNAAEEMYVE